MTQSFQLPSFLSRYLLQSRPDHRYRRLPDVILTTALGIVTVIAASYFAVARTDVGRDALRRTIEQQFAEAFHGRLEIGMLSGNLGLEFLATDVRLFDTRGRLTVRIDTMYARPRWRDLLARRFSVRSLQLIRPTFSLRYQADSTWNIQSALRPRIPVDETGNSWSFHSADLHIVDGAVRTEHIAAAPPAVDAGWLFDYAQAEVRDLEVKATIEWDEHARLIDILSFSIAIPALPITVENAQAQIILEPDRMLLNQFVVEADETLLHADGVLAWDDSSRGLDRYSISASIAPSQLDFSALQRLIPRLPLSGVAEASLRMRGRASAVAIDTLYVARGKSVLQASGNIRSVLDSLDFDVVFAPSTVAPADVQALLPGVSIAAIDHLGAWRIAGTGRGSWTDQTLRGQADLDLEGAPGILRGTVGLTRKPDALWSYAVELQPDSVDLGVLTGDAALTSVLGGMITAEGSGHSMDDLAVELRGVLHDSHIAGRRFDSLNVAASFAHRRLDLVTTLQREEQRVSGRAFVSWDAPTPTFRATLTTERLDLGVLLAVDSLHSSFQSSWTLEGSGHSANDFDVALALEVDSSTTQWGQDVRTLPPHRSAITIRGGETPRLDVAGDVLTLRVASSAGLPVWRPVARLWKQAVQEMRDRQVGRRYDKGSPMDAVAEGAPNLLSSDAEGKKGELEATLQITRSDILSGYLPMAPAIATDLRAEVAVFANGNHLRIEGSVEADSLAIRTVRADHVSTNFAASTHAGGPPEASFDVMLNGHAQRFLSGSHDFGATRLKARGEDGSVDIDLTSARQTRFAGTWDILPDRHRWTFRSVAFTLEEYEWQQTLPAQIDFYTNAIRFADLQLESVAQEGAELQRVTLQGTLSDVLEDTLRLNIDAIGLRQLSGMLGNDHPFGGRMNGEINVTGMKEPVVTGSVTVDALALDDRVLGDFEAFSLYTPGSPDIALVARVTPTIVRDQDSTENRVNVTGAFRLPGQDDAGSIDLAVDVPHADAFFLKYVIDAFSDVQGLFTGTGYVRGSFDHPIFGGDFSYLAGSLRIPIYNLLFAVEGDVRVDEEGIHIDSLTLTDRTGGTANIAGTVFFNDYRHLSFDLAGDLDRVQIINVESYTRDLPFYGSLWASGDITLTGPLDNALLRSDNMATTPRSEFFIPIRDLEETIDPGFILFTDSTGQVPEALQPVQRENILSHRPSGERSFVEGLGIDINLLAPQGSTVQLVIDPLLGDVINAVGSGRMQLQLQEGEVSAYGILTVDSGDYLFTAGEVFVRRFLIDQGTITWTGDPANPILDIFAAYRTRASRTGLPEDVGGSLQTNLPVIVNLHITDALNAVQVALSLALDRSRREAISDTPLLEAYLNQSDRAAQHATSVLLTNSFLLSAEGSGNSVLAGSAFNSVSHLVSSQLNRYLNQVIPNADFTFGLQSDEAVDDLDLSAGIALRLANERLLIRGQGVYRGLGDQIDSAVPEGLQGEFVVEIKLSPSVSIEVFYRREGDVLSETLITSETGVGLTYRTEFTTWKSLWRTILGHRKDDEVIQSEARN